MINTIKIISTSLISGVLLILTTSAFSVPANRFNKVHYDQIRVGMTYEEVQQIMGGEEGEEDRGFRSEADEESLVTRHWMNPDGSSISVVFDAEDKVVKTGSYNLTASEHLNLSRTENNLLQDLSRRPITIEQYNQMKMGMNLNEVAAIMGSQGQLEEDVTSSGGKRYSWLNPNGSGIIVEFDRNQQLQSILTRNLDNYFMGEPIPSNIPDGPILATPQQYYKLQLGMTYPEVQSVMGTDGTLNPDLSSESQEDSQTVYEWKNPDGSGILVFFDQENRASKIETRRLPVGLRSQ